MAITNKPKKALAVVQDVKPKRDRSAVLADILAELSAGVSLDQSCRNVADAPHASTVMLWVEKDPEVAREYASARARGYSLLADRMMTIAAETHSMVTMHDQDPDGNYLFNTDGTPALKQVLVPLSADVMASKRLQVDTLKWQLSKMLPKVYGDKTTTELTGPNGGPMQMAAVTLTGLSDAELETMRALMTKAAGPV